MVVESDVMLSVTSLTIENICSSADFPEASFCLHLTRKRGQKATFLKFALQAKPSLFTSLQSRTGPEQGQNRVFPACVVILTGKNLVSFKEDTEKWSVMNILW